MAYKLFYIHPSGEITESIQQRKPNYNTLRSAVDGIIQEVPHFTKFQGHNRGTAWANEEGVLMRLSYNDVATRAWEKCLAGKKLWTKPRLYGTILFVCKIKEDA